MKTKFTSIVVLLFLLLINVVHAQVKEVKVIEIRNYLLKDGGRDTYIEGFENHLIDTLNAEGNYVLGQYRVKGNENEFVWIRGFKDMAVRKDVLQNFFNTKHWEKYKYLAEENIVNYTNVYLLKPLKISAENVDREGIFPAKWFGQEKGIAVVNFYTANEMREDLIEFVKTKYDSVLNSVGNKNISYWISEDTPNNYPSLPVFQDKNLLVTISFFKNEEEYQEVKKKLESGLSEEIKFTRNRLVPKRETWILYPTDKSFSSN